MVYLGLPIKNGVCIFNTMVITYLVGGAITILKNMSSSMGRMTSHILWKIKNVPNHQQDMVMICYDMVMIC